MSDIITGEMMTTPIERLMQDYDQIGVHYVRDGEAVLVMTTDGISVAIPRDAETVTIVHVEVDPDAITDIDIKTMDAPKGGRR